jgi:hypothetical protein
MGSLFEVWALFHTLPGIPFRFAASADGVEIPYDSFMPEAVWMWLCSWLAANCSVSVAFGPKAMENAAMSAPQIFTCFTMFFC